MDTVIHERILKAFMDMAILSTLTKNDFMSGYDCVEFFRKTSGILVNFGTVYALLYAMERDGLVEGVKNQRERVYKLTEKGEKTIKNVQKMTPEIRKFIKVIMTG
jgi:DNA-binding PadR family transcriptional regulator